MLSSGCMADTTPPLINQVVVGDISATAATIAWETDEPATSQVEYGLTDSYGSNSTLDETLVTEHTVTLTSLEPNKTYHYRLKSKDRAGNEAISTDYTILGARISIAGCSIAVSHVQVDKLYLDFARVVLKNEGERPAEIGKIILGVGESELEGSPHASLDQGEEREFSLPTYRPLEKDIGVKQVDGTIKILGSSEETLAEGSISIPIPTVRIGETIEVQGTEQLSLTFVSLKESDIAVDGPYVSGYYTFTARPGMKFIILIFRLRNNSTRVQETPYISTGEVATSVGYIYSLWNPPGGIYSEEYQPREATSEEVQTLIGDSGGFENLLQGESVLGCVAFEVPLEATPVEASLAYVPQLIELSGN
jgi:hypothetical protein